MSALREVAITESHVRRRGILLVASGSILLSPDSMLLRLMTMDVWTVLFFRGLFGFATFLVIMRIEGIPLRPPPSRSTGPSASRLSASTPSPAMAAGSRLRPSAPRPSASRPSGSRPPASRRFPWPASGPDPRFVVIVFLSATANTCFVYSVRHTAVAIALVIIATAPVFTAMIGAVFTSERVAPRTWIAALLVLAGVASIFALRPQGGPILPDVTALCGALAIATMITVVRGWRGRSVIGAQAGGSLLTALAMIPFADPWHVSARNLGIAIGSGVLILPIALVMVMRGPRYLAAPEVSLLLLLETVLGPIWVWLALGQAPSLQSALTAGVIVAALAVNALLAQRDASSRRVADVQ